MNIWYFTFDLTYKTKQCYSITPGPEIDVSNLLWRMATGTKKSEQMLMPINSLGSAITSAGCFHDGRPPVQWTNV